MKQNHVQRHNLMTLIKKGGGETKIKNTDQHQAAQTWKVEHNKKINTEKFYCNQ